MKVKDGRITLLVGRDSTTIELIDRDANVTFAKVSLTPEQLSKVLSRQAHVECDIEVRSLDRIGKKMHLKKFEFEIPDGLGYGDDRRIKLAEISEPLIPKGWISDNHFASQDTFFTKDDKKYARVTIRTWI